jgi:streptogrisin B
MDETDQGELYIENSPTVGVLEARQAEAISSYEKLLETFNSGLTKSIATSDYPEFFGGAYVNGDGDLVINTVGDSLNARTAVVDRVSTDRIITKQCQYPYKTLLSIMDDLNKFMFNEGNKAAIENLGIHGFYIDDKENKVVVKLAQCTDDKIQAFKNRVLDSQIVSFEESTEMSQAHTNINCGSEIEYKPYGYYYTGSMGYRVKDFSDECIIMSAHVVTTIGQPIYYRGIEVGSCVDRQMSGSIDAALCRISNFSYTPTNTVEGTSITLPTSIATPLSGVMVNMRGKTTQSVVTGNIVNTNATETFNLPSGGSVTLSGVVSASYYGASGDSGGPVWITSGTLGIHEGGKSGMSFFIKASLIRDRFNVSRY